MQKGRKAKITAELLLVWGKKSPQLLRAAVVLFFFKELLTLKAKIIVFDRYLFLAVESLLNFESQ